VSLHVFRVYSGGGETSPMPEELATELTRLMEEATVLVERHAAGAITVVVELYR
jgi:hypothetical protein